MQNYSEWILCPSKSFPGKFYYFNVRNGKAAWGPGDAEITAGRPPEIPKETESHNQPEWNGPPLPYPLQQDFLSSKRQTTDSRHEVTPLISQQTTENRHEITPFSSIQQTPETRYEVTPISSKQQTTETRHLVTPFSSIQETIHTATPIRSKNQPTGDPIKQNCLSFNSMRHPTPVFGQKTFPQGLPKQEDSNVMWTPIQIQLNIPFQNQTNTNFSDECPTFRDHLYISDPDRSQVSQSMEGLKYIVNQGFGNPECQEILVNASNVPMHQRFVNFEAPAITFSTINKDNIKRLNQKLKSSTQINKSRVLEDLRLMNKPTVFESKSNFVDFKSNTPDLAKTGNSIIKQSVLNFGLSLNTKKQELNVGLPSKVQEPRHQNFNVGPPITSPEPVFNGGLLPKSREPLLSNRLPSKSMTTSLNFEPLPNTKEPYGHLELPSKTTEPLFNLEPPLKTKEPVLYYEPQPKTNQLILNAGPHSKTKETVFNFDPSLKTKDPCLSFERITKEPSNQYLNVGPSIETKEPVVTRLPLQTNEPVFNGQASKAKDSVLLSKPMEKEIKKEPKSLKSCIKGDKGDNAVAKSFDDDLRAILISKRKSQDFSNGPKPKMSKQETPAKKKVTFNLDHETISMVSSIEDAEDMKCAFVELYRPTISYLRALGPSSSHQDSWCVLPDTEVLTTELEFIEDFVRIDPTCKLLIPPVVHSWLLALARGCDRPLATAARNVLRRTTSSHVVVQPCTDRDNPTCTNDDILRCCVENMDQNKHLVLISNDLELLTTAKCYPIPCFSLNSIKNGLPSTKQLQYKKDMKITIQNDTANIKNDSAVKKSSNDDDLNEKEMAIIRNLQMSKYPIGQNPNLKEKNRNVQNEYPNGKFDLNEKEMAIIRNLQMSKYPIGQNPNLKEKNKNVQNEYPNGKFQNGQSGAEPNEKNINPMKYFYHDENMRIADAIEMYHTENITPRVDISGIPENKTTSVNISGIPENITPPLNISGKPDNVTPGVNISGIPENITPPLNISGTPENVTPWVNISGIPNGTHEISNIRTIHNKSLDIEKYFQSMTIDKRIESINNENSNKVKKIAEAGWRFESEMTKITKEDDIQTLNMKYINIDKTKALNRPDNTLSVFFKNQKSSNLEKFKYSPNMKISLKNDIAEIPEENNKQKETEKENQKPHFKNQDPRLKTRKSNDSILEFCKEKVKEPKTNEFESGKTNMTSQCQKTQSENGKTYMASQYDITKLEDQDGKTNMSSQLDRSKSNMASTSNGFDVSKPPIMKTRIDLKRFYVKSKEVEDRLEARMDEWVCFYRQVMEESLAAVLENQSPSVLHSPPPWSLFEALQCVDAVYEKNTYVIKIVGYLCFCLYESPYKMKKFINPGEFMRALGCGAKLLEYLEVILPSITESQDGVTALLALLNQIEDDTDPTAGLSESPVPNPLHSKTEELDVRQNIVKNRSEVADYLKKHYAAWKDYDPSQDIEVFRTRGKKEIKLQSKAKGKNVKKDTIDRNENVGNVDVAHTKTNNVGKYCCDKYNVDEIDLFGSDRDETIGVPKENNKKKTGAMGDSNMHGENEYKCNKAKDGNVQDKKGPTIIRNVCLLKEFESKMRKRKTKPDYVDIKPVKKPKINVMTARNDKVYVNIRGFKVNTKQKQSINTKNTVYRPEEDPKLIYSPRVVLEANLISDYKKKMKLKKAKKLFNSDQIEDNDYRSIITDNERDTYSLHSYKANNNNHSVTNDTKHHKRSGNSDHNDNEVTKINKKNNHDIDDNDNNNDDNNNHNDAKNNHIDDNDNNNKDVTTDSGLGTELPRWSLVVDSYTAEIEKNLELILRDMNSEQFAGFPEDSAAETYRMRAFEMDYLVCRILGVLRTLLHQSTDEDDRARNAEAIAKYMVQAKSVHELVNSILSMTSYLLPVVSSGMSFNS